MKLLLLHWAFQYWSCACNPDIEYIEPIGIQFGGIAWSDFKARKSQYMYCNLCCFIYCMYLLETFRRIAVKSATRKGWHSSLVFDSNVFSWNFKEMLYHQYSIAFRQVYIGGVQLILNFILARSSSVFFCPSYSAKLFEYHWLSFFLLTKAKVDI